MIYSIPLDIFNTQDGGCHLFVEATFSDQEKGWLIIDTGANRTVFDKSLLDEYIDLKGEIKEEISAGINATIENIQEAILHKIKIGDFEIENYKTVVISLEYLNNIYSTLTKRQIWGLIGGDFLLKYRCTIDYKNKSLLIEN